MGWKWEKVVFGTLLSACSEKYILNKGNDDDGYSAFEQFKNGQDFYVH